MKCSNVHDWIAAFEDASNPQRHQSCCAELLSNGFSGNATIAPFSHDMEIRRQQNPIDSH
jgi:hypothetical protein